MIDIVAFAGTMKECRRFRALAYTVIKNFRPLGMRCISYHHVPPFGAEDRASSIRVMATGFPDGWLERYTNRQYARLDPIPRRALHTGRVFYWSEVIAKHRANPAQRAYLDDLVEAGVGDGLAVPVFGPHGRNGYVGLGSGQPKGGFTEDQELALPVMAQIAHLRYCELLAAEAGEDITLSSRERDVLLWMTRGKSNAVIADIIDVSPNTVDTYVRRIFRKLAVADRVTASLRASALGLLD